MTIDGTPGARRPANVTHDAGEDARFMSLAFALGRRGLGRTWPNPAVGAVILRHEHDQAVIVGRGWTQPGGRPHAEVEALRRAGEAARGATLYVTLEPCSHHGRSPPCADAIIAAGITRLVSALEDPNSKVAGEGHARLRAAGIAVDVGVGAEDARRAHAGHIRRVREGRPHVILKLAVSADGKVGLAGRRPVAITGDAAREHTHLMRATSDAVLVGIGTALADDPLLTCRLPGMAARSPVRVVLDSRLRLPVASRLVQTAGETPLWIVSAEDASREAERSLRAQGAEIVRVTSESRGVDFGVALRTLAARGITRLLVEGGPIVATALLKAGLVDEAAIFRSRKVIGPEGIDALEGIPLDALTHSPQLGSLGVDQIGQDTVERFARI
jgi:diaminohydroxyphosphoribosylaminopyrimidine deaminase/5-amino-6-(5-phosphoribosylamino)uracil reductase